MRAEIKTWVILTNLLCIICGLFLGLVSIGFVIALAMDFSGLGLFGLICIGGLAILSLSIGLTLFKRVTIDESRRTIGLTYFTAYTRYWTSTDIKGYNTYSVRTKYGTFEQTLVVSKDGKQFSISEGALKNYYEMRDQIKLMFKENKDLSRNEWLVINKTLALFGVVWLLVAVITKVIG
jgi:hypothetical protein